MVSLRAPVLTSPCRRPTQEFHVRTLFFYPLIIITNLYQILIAGPLGQKMMNFAHDHDELLISSHIVTIIISEF